MASKNEGNTVPVADAEESESRNRPRRASKVSYVLKMRLLTRIKKEGSSIKYMANQLGINYSTAKVIVKQNKASRRNKSKFGDQQYLPLDNGKGQRKFKMPVQCSYRQLGHSETMSVPNFPRIEVISTISLKSGHKSQSQTPKNDPIAIQSAIPNSADGPQ